MKRIARFAPIVILLVFVFGAILYSESLKTRAQVGATAPDFTLPLLHGDEVSLTQFRGQPVIVNLWAAWCPPCLEEMPAHDEFYKRYGDRIAYLAVNQRETVNRIERHLNEVAELGLTMTFPIVLDARGQVGDAYRLGGMPETWLVDADGVAREKWVGPVPFEALAAGYLAATGGHIDAADGGPFHDGGRARAVALADDGSLYVAGDRGLARYDAVKFAQNGDTATSGGDDVGRLSPREFTWDEVEGEEVVTLVRTTEEGTIGAITQDGLPGLPAAPITVASDSAGSRLAWVPGHGLFREASGGWEQVETNVGAQVPVGGLAADPLSPGRWMLASGSGLFESRDDGTTWRASGFTAATYAVGYDPSEPRTVYIGTDTGVWKSDDGGRTVERLPASPQRTLVDLDIFTGADGTTTIVAVAPNGDVYVSPDAGMTWQFIFEI